MILSAPFASQRVAPGVEPAVESTRILASKVQDVSGPTSSAHAASLINDHWPPSMVSNESTPFATLSRGGAAPAPMLNPSCVHPSAAPSWVGRTPSTLNSSRCSNALESVPSTGSTTSVFVRFLPDANTTRWASSASSRSGKVHFVGFSASSVRCQPSTFKLPGPGFRTSIQSESSLSESRRRPSLTARNSEISGVWAYAVPAVRTATSAIPADVRSFLTVRDKNRTPHTRGHPVSPADRDPSRIRRSPVDPVTGAGRHRERGG